MVAVVGLVGLRPAPETVAELTAPPYDVIKAGTPLEALLDSRQDSIFHVTLGDDPAAALEALKTRGALVEETAPSFFVYEQRWGEAARTGVFVAPEVSAYSEGQIIRHEKTFDEKVEGRLSVRRATGYSFGPVFLLTRGRLGPVFELIKEVPPLYDFVSEFGAGAGLTDLHGVHSRVWRVEADSDWGRDIQAALAPHPLYIADGHHRYHASLLSGQTHVLAYVTEEAEILAYNRVVNGRVPFKEIQATLPLQPVPAFVTPPAHQVCLYSKAGCFLLKAKEVPEDVVGGLDCAILERELYPALGLGHDQIVDPTYFDYYPESALEEMKAAVDRGDYELAIALHPVSLDQLMAVADAGLKDSEVVMPEKSTFFAPKILTGLIAYRHSFHS